MTNDYRPTPRGNSLYGKQTNLDHANRKREVARRSGIPNGRGEGQPSFVNPSTPKFASGARKKFLTYGADPSERFYIRPTGKGYRITSADVADHFYTIWGV